MERKKRYKIKQMMPIPEGYEVMQAIVQGDGSRMMEAAADSIFPYCLVLLEGKVMGTTILNSITSFLAMV